MEKLLKSRKWFQNIFNAAKNISSPLVWLILAFSLQLLSSLGAWGQSELHNYQKAGAEHNPELKALFNQYLATMEKIPQSKALPDPQVAFGYFISPVETRLGAQRGNISISQMFPWFGTLNAQSQVFAGIAKAKLENFEDAKLALYNKIENTYDELYFLNKSIRITQDNLDLLTPLKGLARVNFESGKSGLEDVLRIEMEQTELKDKLAYLQDSQAPLLAQFEQLINQQLDGPLNMPDTLWTSVIDLDKSTLTDSMLANSPKLQQFDYEAQSYKQQQVVAEKMGLPSFNIGFNYINVAPRKDVEMADNGKDAFMFPQVGVKIPLYRGKYKAMKKEAELQEESSMLRKENRQNTLRTDLEQVYRDYLDAVRKVTLYRRLADLSSRTLNLLQEKYSTAGANFEEVIRMERKWLGYSLALEKARADRNSTAANINYLIGKR